MAGKKNKTKTAGTKKGIFNSLLVRLLVAAAFVGCAVLIVTTEMDRSAKEKEAVLIQSKITEYERQNAELQQELDSDDISSYMEKAAMEDYGYAYPDEWRFYDVSRD